jgi:hypothetical protein
MSKKGESPPKSVDAQLAELQSDYISHLHERTVPVLAAWQAYLDSEFSPDLLNEVYRGVHAIAGTSSILKVSPIDSLSNKAQVQIQSLLPPAGVDMSLIAEVAETLNELHRVALSGDVKAPPINLNG